MQRLYVVGRADLVPGLRAAQLCHAARLFADEHPEVEGAWYRDSNNLVLLEVEDEAELVALAARARCAVSINREPDLGNEVTAIALAPSAKPLVRHLPLALAG
jgi:peptidyl-tRNA hydrolase